MLRHSNSSQCVQKGATLTLSSANNLAQGAAVSTGFSDSLITAPPASSLALLQPTLQFE